MRYPDLESFKAEIRGEDPKLLIQRWLTDGNPCAFSSTAKLDEFAARIAKDYPYAENVLIAGSSNWQYSLNPKKSFSKFHPKSDIDVVLISPIDFEETWTRLRDLHRRQWYSWDRGLREKVLRTGQNVYCGFISPKHIPDRANEYRFEFLQRCNSYSTASVGYREVRLMFFKNDEDVIDYYVRGVRLARGIL